MFAESRKEQKKCSLKRDFIRAKSLSEKPLTRREFDIMTTLIGKEADRLERESHALLRVAEYELKNLKRTVQRMEQPGA